jgi:Reverse transcriptase (RNA-dependent DNA polymerase)
MIIRKAQYGLKSSGKCWHDKLHDVLKDLGFFPSKAEEDIWMRDKGDHYEYLAVYVDDLLIASKDPQAIIDSLTSKPVNFKLKGTGPVIYHLGCDYFRDENGILCVAPLKYIDRMADTYRELFGVAPKQNIQSPMEKGDHPELDDSPLLEEDGIHKYQSLIGTLQWTISLGRFDIATAVMTMSSFRVAPREGHLTRLRRICGYLVKFRSACIRIRTEMPDYSDLPSREDDWSRTVYGDVREQKAEDAPPPKGKIVRTTTYKDANLHHDMATGRAVTGVLHFLNGTPIEWYTRKQPTVETATYGSEFTAAKTAIQQIAALRLTLQYLGVNIEPSAYMFGDNESVVKSSTIPQSQLGKRHHALAYHFAREAIASKMVVFSHLPSELNVADILSKHWGHSQVYQLLKPIFFYVGDTLDLIREEGS